MGLLDTAKAHLAVRKFQKSTLGQALRQHTQYYMNETKLREFSQENKDKFAQDFMSKLVDINNSPNAGLALREKLVEMVLVFCGLQVACLKKEELAGAFYADSPYISGELWPDILEIAKHSDELGQCVFANPGITVDELVDFANTRCALALYYANGFNMVRIELGDTVPAKDWFKPLVEATLVWEEDTMREKLGLPRLCPGAVGGLPWSLMWNMVLSGVQNPFYAWTKDWPDRYLAGEGPKEGIASDNDLARYAERAS